MSTAAIYAHFVPLEPDAALAIAKAFVAAERSWATVTGLLEDTTDYFVVLKAEHYPLGPGPLFISKATGQVWSDAYGHVLDKIDAMTSCASGSGDARASE